MTNICFYIASSKRCEVGEVVDLEEIFEDDYHFYGKNPQEIHEAYNNDDDDDRPVMAVYEIEAAEPDELPTIMLSAAGFFRATVFVRIKANWGLAGYQL